LGLFAPVGQESSRAKAQSSSSAILSAANRSTKRRKEHAFKPGLVNPAQLVFLGMLPQEPFKRFLSDTTFVHLKPSSCDPQAHSIGTNTEELLYILLGIAVRDAR